MKKQRSLPARMLLGTWHMIDGARKVVLNLVFFLIVYLVIVALIDSGDRLIVQPDTALVLRPQGDVVEQYSGTPLDHFLMQASETGRQETRLRDLLEARAQVRDEVRVAEIMSVDANPYRHNIIIDIGEREGAYDGQALVDASGVIGQVIETGLTTSQAMLISDPSHSLPVEVNRTGARTIVNGTGEIDRLDLPFVTNNTDIRPGDLLVTSGLGGAFPAGYPVAVVETVTRVPQEPFADVTARPAASLDQVREVMLIWSTQGQRAAEVPDE